jgi:hypothetical protein
MKKLALKKALFGLLVASLSTGFVSAQSMALSVTTKTYGGGYAPRHVLTCWITNSAGTYVYNIKRNGYNYLSSLTNWTACSSSSKSTDGTTAATLTSHSSMAFSWNCKNTSSVVVPDGTYYINIEFTEQEGTKQYVKYSFVKGATSKTSSAPTIVTANSFYTSPLLTYTAPAVALSTTQVTNFDYLYSNSDHTLQLDYDAANHSDIKLQLVNLKGQTVFQSSLKGSGKESLQLPSCAPGIYLIRLTDKEGWNQTKKMVI